MLFRSWYFAGAVVLAHSPKFFFHIRNALFAGSINDEYDTLMADIVELNKILENPKKQRSIIKEELKEIAEKYGDDRKTQIVPGGDTDLSVEDLIPNQEVVVTITRGGYAKRTRADLYRSQRRGGKGVKGAALKQDDIVEHFFTADRKSTRLNSSHVSESRMPSSA